MSIDFLLDTMEKVGIRTIVLDDSPEGWNRLAKLQVYHSRHKEPIMTENIGETHDQETSAMLDKLTAAFDIAKSAVTGESSMRKELNAMKAEFTSLQTRVKNHDFEIEEWKERSKVMDGYLLETRRERNEARQRIGELEMENSALKQQVAVHQRESNNWMEKFNLSEGELSQKRTQLRDLEDDHLKLMAENEKLQATIGKFKEFLGATEPEPKHTFQEIAEGPLETPQTSETTTSSSETQSQTSGGGGDSGATKGEIWPSMLQPHEEGTGRFAPYPGTIKPDEAAE